MSTFPVCRSCGVEIYDLLQPGFFFNYFYFFIHQYYLWINASLSRLNIIFRLMMHWYLKQVLYRELSGSFHITATVFKNTQIDCDLTWEHHRLDGTHTLLRHLYHFYTCPPLARTLLLCPKQETCVRACVRVWKREIRKGARCFLTAQD